MFKYLKLRRALKYEQEKNKELLRENQILWKELTRRDQKIIEQQKRMRFFGIEIDNEEYHPDKIDFPSVLKL